MSFAKVNSDYEAWLRTQCSVVEDDLRLKHKRMKKSPFLFLRATYFRWAGRIGNICPELEGAPQVASIGDSHVENYGTWRDGESRLVWGINDFDEAATMPYPYDIVRLATSARLSTKRQVNNADGAAAILRGYVDGLKDPRPMLLDQKATWMREKVVPSDDDREQFWRNLDDVKKTPNAMPPRGVQTALTESLPKGGELVRFGRRTKGGGSLGRPRFVAIASWRGGRIAREAKALVASAWYWAHGAEMARSHLMEVAHGTFRAPDPHLHVRDGFIIRRIAPDSRKIDVTDLADEALTLDLLESMGRDIGSIHASDVDERDKIIEHLKSRPRGWLHKAAKAAEDAVQEDYADWGKRSS